MSCLLQALVVLAVAALVKFVPSRYFLWFKFQETTLDIPAEGNASKYEKTDFYSRLLDSSKDAISPKNQNFAINDPTPYQAPALGEEGNK